jgi:hypothetical protein
MTIPWLEKAGRHLKAGSLLKRSYHERRDTATTLLKKNQFEVSMAEGAVG